MIDSFFYDRYIDNAIKKSLKIYNGEEVKVDQYLSYSEIKTLYLKRDDFLVRNFMTPISKCENGGLIVVRFHYVNFGSVYYYNSALKLLMLIDEDPEWLIEV